MVRGIEGKGERILEVWSLCRWGVVSKKVLEERVWSGVLDVCVDVRGRQGSQGSCGEYLCGWSDIVCTLCGRGLAASVFVLGEV